MELRRRFQLALLALVCLVAAGAEEAASHHIATAEEPTPQAQQAAADKHDMHDVMLSGSSKTQQELVERRAHLDQEEVQAKAEVEAEADAEEGDAETMPDNAGMVAEGSVEDNNAQCHAWAVAGECIRNPQYMFAECNDACNSQVYVDAEDDCHGWASAGECEKNPGFMFNRCNASCMSHARRSLHDPHHTARQNPHLLDDGDQQHRAATFVP